MVDVLRERLAATPLWQLAPEQEDVLSLEHSQTVGDALKLLAKHQILSAPLVVSPGLEDVESLDRAETAPALVGWLDIKDIIRAFIVFLREHNHKLPTSMLALMTELEKQGPVFAHKMLITVLGSEDRGLVFQTDADASVLAAVRDLFLGQHADGGRLVHRLAIFDAHGDITRVVSQMDVLRLLRTHQAHLGPCASQTLQELGLVDGDMAKDIVMLAPNTPTLLAYEQLAAAGVTGAPVVSAEGELIANLSISDIRGIQPDHFGVLALPVAEFLALRHNTSFLGYAQHSATTSAGAAHPFFASGPPGPGHPRPAGADAADADAAAAAAAAAPAGSDAAADAPASAGSGGVARPGSSAGRPASSSGLPSPRGGGGGLARTASGRRRSSSSGSDAGLRLITCARDDTLLTVLCNMCDNQVHRVYVREVGAKPCEVIGVITPTDLLRLVAGESGWLRRANSLHASSVKRPAGDEPMPQAGAAAGPAAGGGAAAGAAPAAPPAQPVPGLAAGDGSKKPKVAEAAA